MGGDSECIAAKDAIIKWRPEIDTKVERFGEEREFASWDEFESAWTEYAAANFIHFRCRTSQTAVLSNKR